MTSRQASNAASSSANTAKKGKSKKGNEGTDASEQIAAKIAQIELNNAEDKEQEAEFDAQARKATRDLSGLLTKIEKPLAKVDLLLKKYTELFKEMKRVERDHIKSKKRADQLQKDKDAQRSEITRTVAIKDRLEKLSRDVTNENKKHKADISHFKEVETRIQQDIQERVSFIIDNLSERASSQAPGAPGSVDLDIDLLFRQKFASFVEQYELREVQYELQLRQRSLALQLQVSKLKGQLKAQELEASKSHQLTRQVSTFSQTETELRTQLNIYVEKFKQVEDTLNNSNELFLTFRKEMEDMSKKTKRLEKENQTLKRKQEGTNRNIVEMVEQNTKYQKQLALVNKRNEQLQSLCREMQAQGRGLSTGNGEHVDGDEELDEGDDEDGTESEYEYDDEDDSPDDHVAVTHSHVPPRQFGPPPPPPPALPAVNGTSNGKASGRTKTQVNGSKR